MSYISNPLKLIRPTWEAFKLCWLNLLLLTLALIGAILVSVGAGVALGLFLGPFAVVLFLLALPAILFVTGIYGWATTKVTIAAARGHKLPFRQTLPTNWKQPLMFVGTSLVAGFLIFFGLLLLIVPGLVFLAWFALATYAVVDKGLPVIESLKYSREQARGRSWEILGAATLVPAIGIFVFIPVLGLLVYVIASLILIPIYAVRYNQLIELKKKDNWENTPISPVNYVVLVLGVIGYFVVNVHQQNFQKELQWQLENEIQTRELQEGLEKQPKPD